MLFAYSGDFILHHVVVVFFGHWEQILAETCRVDNPFFASHAEKERNPPPPQKKTTPNTFFHLP